MNNLYDRHERHLLLEEPNNKENSFIANVNIVANAIDDVITVSRNINHVITVSNAIDDVITVSDNIDDVKTVANKIDDVVTVSQHIVNVDKVANSINNVNTVATNINSVNIAARDIASIVKVASENIPELDRHIDQNRQLIAGYAVQIASDRAIAQDVLEKANNKSQEAYRQAQQAVDKSNEAIEHYNRAINDVDGRILGIETSTTEAVTKLSNSFLNLTSRVYTNEVFYKDKAQEIADGVDNKVQKVKDDLLQTVETVKDSIKSIDLHTTDAITKLALTDIEQSDRIQRNKQELDVEIKDIKESIKSVDINTANAISKLVLTNVEQSIRIQGVQQKLDNETKSVRQKLAETVNPLQEYADNLDNIFSKIDNEIHDIIEANKERDINTATALAKITDTDINQTLRINRVESELKDSIRKEITNNIVAITTLSDSIIEQSQRSVKTKIQLDELSDRIEQEAVNSTKNFVSLTCNTIGISNRLTDLNRRFNEKEVNDTENFSHLAAASVWNTEHIVALDDFRVTETVSECLVACKEALTSIIQSLRITSLYNRFKNINVTDMSGLDGAGTVTDGGVIGNSIVDDDDTDDLFIDGGIIPEP